MSKQKTKKKSGGRKGGKRRSGKRGGAKRKSKVVRPSILSMASAIRHAVVEDVTTPEVQRVMAMQKSMQLEAGKAFMAVKGERPEAKSLRGIGKTLVGQIKGRKRKGKRR